MASSYSEANLKCKIMLIILSLMNGGNNKKTFSLNCRHHHTITIKIFKADILNEVLFNLMKE